MNLTVKILTPATSSQYEAQWVDIKTSSGSMIVQYGHVPLIGFVVPQKISMLLASGALQYVDLVTNGIARIDRTHVIIIAS